MAQQIDREWIKFKTEILRSSDVSLTLSILKMRGAPSTIRTWMPELLKIDKARKILSPAAAPAKFPDIHSDLDLPDTDLWKEATWAGSILLTHRELISEWHASSKTIEELSLQRKFKDAIAELDSLESKIGLSLWSISCRLSLLVQIDGVDAQKSFGKQIWGNKDVSPLVQFYAYYASMRCEPRISCWRYDSHANDACETIDSKDAVIKQFFSFLINFYGPVEFEDTANILWRHSAFPVIDLYLALIKCMAIAAAKGVETKRIPNAWMHILKSLYVATSDYRLNNLAFCWGEKPDFGPPGPRDKLIECLDYYTKGEYSKCICFAINEINRQPNEFAYVELVAKSSARLANNNFSDIEASEVRDIVSEMCNVLLKTNDAEKCANSLRKRCYTDPHSAFYSQLFGFCQHEFMSDGFTVTRHDPSYAYLASASFNPRLGLAVQPDQRLTYLSKLLSLYPYSPTLLLYKSMADGSPLNLGSGIDPSRFSLFEARRLISIGEPRKAIETLRAISNTPDTLVSQDTTLALNRAAIDCKDWSLSLRTMVAAFVSNPNILARLPLAEVLQNIQRLNAISEGASDIAFPIAAHIYTQYVGLEMEYLRDCAYEEFLGFWDLKRPSELASHLEKHSKDEIVYFLKHVCIESVLDNSVTFKSTEDVQHERIAVLRLIMDINPQDSDYCSEQIKEITKQLVVRRAVQQVEQSGIHVEVNGIKRVIEKSLRESYSRYVDLCATIDDQIQADFLVRLGKALGAEASNFQILIPGDERRSLLIDMFREVRDHFVSSNEFGLDGYLSTGMRHGTLAGQIRAPFERENLITQRDDSTNVYREPQVWLERYSHLSVADKRLLSQVIKDFSRDIDALIERTRVQWIQIRTERSTGEGMFDFRISSSVISSLQQLISPGTPYENFIELIFDFLWEITDSCLERIRSNLTLNLKSDITRTVSSLEHEVRAVLEYESNTEILAAITRSGTNSQYAVDKIASWFRRAPTPEMEAYSMDLPISIAKEFMSNLFPYCNLNISVDVQTEFKLNGRSLKSIVQILFILLDNVKKHSGLSNTNMPVAIKVTDEKDQFTIEVVNDLSQEPAVEVRTKHLQTVLENVGQGNRFGSVPIEGGSGLQKIERIVRVDLQCQPRLNFCVTQDGKFSAQVSLILKHLVA